jgi:hypothetical protein
MVDYLQLLGGVSNKSDQEDRLELNLAALMLVVMVSNKSDQEDRLEQGANNTSKIGNALFPISPIKKTG